MLNDSLYEAKTALEQTRLILAHCKAALVASWEMVEEERLAHKQELDGPCNYSTKYWQRRSDLAISRIVSRIEWQGFRHCGRQGIPDRGSLEGSLEGSCRMCDDAYLLSQVEVTQGRGAAFTHASDECPREMCRKWQERGP